MKKVLCILTVAYVLLSGRISSSRANGISLPAHSSPPTMTLPHTTQTANPREIVGVLALAICVGLAQIALVAGAIAYQFPRTLSYDPSDEWENADYVRALPNALAELSELHFASAWPRQCNPWSLNRFQRRLERALTPLLKRHVQRFVRQHLSVWRWTVSHRHTVAQLLEALEREDALRRLSAADPEERIALLAMLNNCPQDHLKSHGEPIERTLRRLKGIQAILREHGYSLKLKADRDDQQCAESLAHHPAPTTVTKRTHQTFAE